MKMCIYAVISLVVAVIGSSVRAQDLDLASPIGDTSCGYVCRGGWQVDAEVPFLRFHVAGGAGDTLDDETDFDASFRTSIAYIRGDGTGLRIRYWTIDQDNHDNTQLVADQFDVDTYTLDFEVFRSYQWDCQTQIELSAGIRYNDYELNASGQRGLDEDLDFDGCGGIVGLRADYDACCCRLFASLRYAILMDDAVIDGDLAIDHKVGVHEIQFGVGKDICFGCYNLALHTAVEWSNWDGYTGSDGEGAVGWGGYVIGATLEF